MTWLVPWALAAAAGAAGIVGLLHLLARDRPARWLLPTARFVRAGTARATRRARTPRDRRLLALRVLALLLAGTGFAGPVRDPEGGSVARIVLLEAPAGAGADSALRAARGRLEPGDRLVVFDTVASVVPAGAEAATLDSLARVVADPSGAGGPPRQAMLSAGLIAAMRVAGEAAAAADSVAMIVVSPLRGVEDDATRAIRSLWPGRIEIVQVPSLAGDTIPRLFHVRGPAADAVVAAARLGGASVPAGRIPAGATLLVRDALTAADSAFARAGGTLVSWPAAAPTASGSGAADTTGGFVVGEAVVPFVAARRAAPPGGDVVARWVDGAPAITEVPLGAGCFRTVAIELPAAGDLTLRPAFQQALRDLAAPCAGHRQPAATDSLRVALAGSGPLAGATTLRRDASRSPATPWLLGAALLLLLLEPFLRRDGGGAAPARMEAA